METATVIEQEQPTPTPAVVTGSQEAAPTMTLSSYGGKLTRKQLSKVPTPDTLQLFEGKKIG